MKPILKLLLLVILVVVLFMPGTAMAKGLQDDKVITGGTYTLQSGEILDGNLIILGGVVTTLMNSTVQGDTVLMGGTLTINGNIAKNVVAIGGIVTLGDNAIIHGDLIVVAGTLNRENGAVIEGQVVNGFQIPRNWINFRGVDVPDVPQIGSQFTPLWKGLWFFFRTFLWAAVAALIAIFFPNPTDRVARAIASQTILSGGVGLLTAIVAPLVLLILAITIILIPVSLLGFLVLGAAWCFGRVSLGMDVGRRIGDAFHKDWPAAVDAGLGTFALVLMVDGVGDLIPCIGWIIPTLVGILGLGGVILTVFGTRSYPPQTSDRTTHIPPTVSVFDSENPPTDPEKIE